VISDLISQKAGIEGQRREMERWEDNERREREDARRGARERVVSDFERGMALGGRGGRRRLDEKVDGVESGGGFKFDGETVERVAKEAEEKALRSIEGEQVEARKSRLAAFWLPSLTPEAKLGPLKDVKLYTMCHVGGTAHPISYVALSTSLPGHGSTSSPRRTAAS
jgi:nitric oxide synthase-interacting protein